MANSIANIMNKDRRIGYIVYMFEAKEHIMTDRKKIRGVG